jgi:hypothetical protein
MLYPIIHPWALDPSYEENDKDSDRTIPAGVWQCLLHSRTLYVLVLVFPVVDMTTLRTTPLD